MILRMTYVSLRDTFSHAAAHDERIAKLKCHISYAFPENFLAPEGACEARGEAMFLHLASTRCAWGGYDVAPKFGPV